MNNKDEQKEYITILNNKRNDLITNKAILESVSKANKFQNSLQRITNIYTKSIIPVLTNEKNLNQMNSLSKALNSITPAIKSISNAYIQNYQAIMNSISISDLVSDYINRYQTIINAVLKKIQKIPISKLNTIDTIMLNKYYWVIPFEYEYGKVNKLSKYKTRKNFETFILKYFNDNRVKRLFSKIKKQFQEKDKKVLLKQIECSFYKGDYAICITSLMTLFDGATLILIQPNSWNQHNSHKVIGELLNIMNEKTISEYGYELYLKTDILNNFIMKLYPQNYDLKGSRKKQLLSRPINSHGVKYLNDKVNALRLLNALYFCNDVINDTNLEEKFSSKNRNGKFSIVED